MICMKTLANPNAYLCGATLFGWPLFKNRTESTSPSIDYGPSLEIEDIDQLEKDTSVNKFMAEPVTDKDTLLKERHLMRRRMELFILNVQRNVFRSLLSIEQNASDETLPVYHYTADLDTEIAKNVDDMVKIDRWTRKEGGGGITCIIHNGRVFEKAGVNISVVHGSLPPAAVQQMKSRGKQFSSNFKNTDQIPFFAAGVSSVIHPRNPHVPTIHFNYRYFEIDQKVERKLDEGCNQEGMWWFGGGTDLTPYLLDEGDCKHFHSELKRACDKHDSSYYGKFKSWCDKYFYIVHRQESRGVGGIFFDDIDKPDQEAAFKFVRSCAQHILPSYIPLVLKNANSKYRREDRDWQLIRRGRYTEFNLVYDRGTKFGLFTPGARYESILMSLPLYAKWVYCHEPEPGSIYAKLMEVLKEPREWI